MKAMGKRNPEVTAAEKLYRADWAVGLVDGRVQVLKDRDGVCRNVSLEGIAALARLVQDGRAAMPDAVRCRIVDACIVHQEPAQEGCERGDDHSLGECVAEIVDEWLDELGHQPEPARAPCPGIEVEPGVYSGCTGGLDCPVCEGAGEVDAAEED